MAIRGDLGLGGGHDFLARGTIRVSGPHELTAIRSAEGAYEPDGAVAESTFLRPPGLTFRFTQTPERLPAEDVVSVHEEEVVWGGNLFGHYGHFLVEALTRLWPLVPGAELEGLPVVFSSPNERPFAREWLEGFGAEAIFPPEQGLVRLKRMFVPEPSWRIGAWLAPELRDIHLHARRGLDIPPTPRHDVLWLSRSRLRRERVAYDEGLLEWILGDRVTAVNLETMPLAEQVGTLESSRAVAGAVGSAFHTLLLTAETPDSLYLCPSFNKSPFPAQHRFLNGDATFVQALAPAARVRRVRRMHFGFPGGYRFLIPEALNALDATVIPGLLEDARIAAFACPEQRRRNGGSGGGIDAAVTRVLRDPFSAEARMRLGEMFKERGLNRCADEQLTMAADLADDPVEA